MKEPTVHEKNLQAYLMTRAPDTWRPLPQIVCADGFQMSVQASRHNYCEPRADKGPWISVEIGFPSKIEPLLWEYAEGGAHWTETVYGYVPIQLAAAVIECHGGMVPPER